MTIPAVTDELWQLVQPLLPIPTRHLRYPGRKRLDDRKCLNGILYVLATGIAWEQLPQQLGYGSGMTCWRRGCGTGTPPASGTSSTGYY